MLCPCLAEAEGCAQPDVERDVTADAVVPPDDPRARAGSVALDGHRVGDDDASFRGGAYLKEAAALRIEQPEEHRRRIEPRPAEPVDASIARDQCRRPAVADERVIDSRRRCGSRPCKRHGRRFSKRRATINSTCPRDVVVELAPDAEVREVDEVEKVAAPEPR